MVARKFPKKYLIKSAETARSNVEIGILVISLGLMTILAEGFAATHSVWVSLTEDASYFVGGILILCGLHPLWIGIKGLKK